MTTMIAALDSARTDSPAARARPRTRRIALAPRRSSALALLFALAIAASGCFQHTFTLGTGAPDGTPVYRAWHHHWLFGLIRPELQEEIVVAKLCPSGNATLHEETTFLNGLIDVLIGIIYSPTTVTITCADGSQTEIVLDSEEISEIVTDPLFLEIVEDQIPERLADVEAALTGFEEETAARLPATAR
jgi:hypothetical protein